MRPSQRTRPQPAIRPRRSWPRRRRRCRAAQASLDRLTPDAAQVQAALAAVENAKAQLAQLEQPADERAVLEASLKAAQAGRDLAASQLKNATLVAPFAGAVMKLDIDPGEYAAPGAAVVLLADTSAWQVETTDLTELNVAEIGEESPVTRHPGGDSRAGTAGPRQRDRAVRREQTGRYRLYRPRHP